MISPKEPEITDILLTIQLEKVDPRKAFDRAFEIVYDELARVATLLIEADRDLPSRRRPVTSSLTT